MLCMWGWSQVMQAVCLAPLSRTAETERSVCMHLQDWSQDLFGALREAGGTAYSNYAVGYNNVHVPSATENRIAVGNTPGALQCMTVVLYCTASVIHLVKENKGFVHTQRSSFSYMPFIGLTWQHAGGGAAPDLNRGTLEAPAKPQPHDNYHHKGKQMPASPYQNTH